MAEIRLTEQDFTEVLLSNTIYDGTGWVAEVAGADSTIIFQRYIYPCESWIDLEVYGTHDDNITNITVSSRTSATGDKWSPWCLGLTAPINSILQLRFVVTTSDSDYVAELQGFDFSYDDEVVIDTDAEWEQAMQASCDLDAHVEVQLRNQYMEQDGTEVDTNIKYVGNPFVGNLHALDFCKINDTRALALAPYATSGRRRLKLILFNKTCS